MPTPKRLHFICRGALNIVDLPDGSFESGIWFVASRTALSATEVYLHEGRHQPSYRQGRIVGRRTEPYRGKDRYIFTLQPIAFPMNWEGGGTGEKGYGY